MTHSHSQDHSHGHLHGHGHGHSHSHVPDSANERRIAWAMWITGGFMIVEAAGGWMSGSLALIADAGHMLTDTGALALAWLAVRLARRPADTARSFGYMRAEILAAFLNGAVMIALGGWIIVEVVMRIADPVPVLAGPMLVVAIVGLLVNIVSFKLLHGGEGNLNMRGAALHVLGDLLGSVAAIVAAIIIMYTGFTPIDPILSVFVAVLILRGAVAVTRDAAHILMEGTPEDLDTEAMTEDLASNIPSVADIHHVHAWSLASGRTLVTLHAVPEPGASPATALTAIKERLAERYGVTHATVQIEPEDCPDQGEVLEKLAGNRGKTAC